MQSLQNLTGRQLRDLARAGTFTGVTSGVALGYVQANLVVLPREQAFDFLLFCQRNPKPCPLLDVTEAGDPEPKLCAPTADLRTDVPCYRIYRHGELVDEPTDIVKHWQQDSVAFLLGCSFTFESALLQAGLPVRHIEANCNLPMYRTNIACQPAGVFHGPMVVSMRPFTPAKAIRAVQVTTRFPSVHGAPVHLGKPEMIGIKDIGKPDYGDAVPVRDDELPVFWACGVTPQAALVQARLPLAITHAPGSMLVTDLLNHQLASF
jgi:uncharacterized protein YcsI (UPF0317 family)